MRRRLKIILHNHDIKNSIFGAVQIIEQDGWLCLDRFSKRQRERLNDNERLGKRALSSSGIMLDFWTDSTTLAFDYQTFIASNKMFFYFDIYVNGQLLFHEGKEETYKDEGRVSVSLEEGKKRITVYFPCLFGTRIRNVEIDDNAELIPVEKEKNILFLGDSITQGYSAKFSSLTYTNAITRSYDANCLNQAIGGNIFNEDDLDEFLAFQPDIIFVAFGTNDWKQGVDVSTNAERYFAKLNKIYPNVPINVILPIWRGDIEELEKTTPHRFMEVREIVREKAEKYPNTTVIYSIDFLPRCEDVFEDKRLHPNDIGFVLYAEGLQKNLILKTCVASTPFFQSLSEKAELQLKGTVNCNLELTYVLYAYDIDEVESEVHAAKVVSCKNGSFAVSYKFDPISLAVYKNATRFRAKLYSETTITEVELSEFSFREVSEVEEILEEQKASNSNLTTNEKGEKCVLVQKGSGEKITVPLIPQKVLFIGNSLLLGMFNTYGMCSSSPKKDYAYLVQQKLLEYNEECMFSKLHGGNFEHAENIDAFEAWFFEEDNVYTGKPAKESFSRDLDLILIQLTDNINTDAKIEAFGQIVNIFMERIKKMCPEARIIWIHGWYNKANTLNKLVEVCDYWGIERVDISDLHVKENESYSGQISWHPEECEVTVKDTWTTHPGDKGMEKIAERIIETLGIL